jgi:hypothetical protein
MPSKEKNPWKKCRKCKDIPSGSSADFIGRDAESDLPLDLIKELPGIKGNSLSSGWVTWIAVCDVCGTKYQATVDVEPFLWDMTFNRCEDQSLKKSEFLKDQYNFEALKFATKLEILFMDDTSKIMIVQNYWHTDDRHADLIEGYYEDGSPIDGQLFFPSPEIQEVRILESQKKENHVSHPDHEQTFPTIDRYYEDKIKRLNS